MLGRHTVFQSRAFIYTANVCDSMTRLLDTQPLNKNIILVLVVLMKKRLVFEEMVIIFIIKCTFLFQQNLNIPCKNKLLHAEVQDKQNW